MSSLKSDCLANWLKVCYYFAIISTVNSSFSTNQPTNQSFIQRRKNIVIIRFDDDYSSFASVPSVILHTNRIRYEIVQISSYYIPSFFSYIHHYVCNITRCMIKSLDYYSLPEYTATTCWIRLDIERSRVIITCAFFNVGVVHTSTRQPHTFWIINNVPLFI